MGSGFPAGSLGTSSLWCIAIRPNRAISWPCKFSAILPATGSGTARSLPSTAGAIAGRLFSGESGHGHTSIVRLFSGAWRLCGRALVRRPGRYPGAGEFSTFGEQGDSGCGSGGQRVRCGIDSGDQMSRFQTSTASHRPFPLCRRGTRIGGGLTAETPSAFSRVSCVTAAAFFLHRRRGGAFSTAASWVAWVES